MSNDKHTDAARVGRSGLVRTFSDDQQNALMTALQNAAIAWNGETYLTDDEMKEAIYHYIETTPRTSLIVELVDELNRLGWRISPNTSDEPTPAHSTNRKDTNANDNK